MEPRIEPADRASEPGVAAEPVRAQCDAAHRRANGRHPRPVCLLLSPHGPAWRFT